MKKLKTLNYKILSTLPVISVCLATTSQTSSAMLRSALSSFSRVLQTSSKNTITTNSPQTVKYLYRSGARVSILDSNPLKNTNPNSSFSTKSTSVNSPTTSTNIYRSSRTLSVLGNDIFQNNNGNSSPLNLTSKLTPYSPANTQQPISNKNSNQNTKPPTSKTTYDSGFNAENFGKSLGNLMGNSLSKVLELKQTKFLYDYRNGNTSSSAIYTKQNIFPNAKNNTFVSEAKIWGTILGNSMSAALDLTATNINPSILSQTKK